MFVLCSITLYTLDTKASCITKYRLSYLNLLLGFPSLTLTAQFILSASCCRANLYLKGLIEIAHILEIDVNHKRPPH